LRAVTEAASKAQLKSQKHEQELQDAMERERLVLEQRLLEQKKHLEREHSKLREAHTAEKDSLIG